MSRKHADRIRVRYRGDAELEDAIAAHRDYVAGETLAVDFAPGTVENGALEAVIDGKPLNLALEVVAGR